MLQNNRCSEHSFEYRTSASRHVSGMPLRSVNAPRWSGVIAAVAVVVAASARPSAQFERTISATFDGWTHLADGSYDLVFGYMNRNADEIDIPVGAANQVDPAPAD